MAKKTFLILAPYSDQSLSLARLLRKANSTVHAGLVGEKQKRWYLKHYERCISVDVTNLPTLNKVYSIVPTTASMTQFYLQHCERAKLNDIVLTRNSMIANDKPKMLGIVKDLGVPVPVTCYDSNKIDCFPVFYKQNYERGRGARGIARSPKELEKLHGDTLLYQEYIEGHSTFGVAFLATDGEIVDYCMHDELLSKPKPGGSAVILKEHHDTTLLEYTKRIVKHTGYSGWGLAEYKYCPKRKDYVFMEVNAKLWASCEFSFLNNPRLFNRLFPDTPLCNSEEPEGAVFFDRLIGTSLVDILHNAMLFRRYHIVSFQKPLYVTMQNLLPGSFVRTMKMIANSIGSSVTP